MFALEANSLVSVEKGTWVQAQSLDVPKDGLLVWLRDFGEVKLFRTRLKNQVRHYIIHLLEANDSNDNGLKLDTIKHTQFESLHDCHWQIEQYHCAIKQVCHIESFQVRGKKARRGITITLNSLKLTRLCNLLHNLSFFWNILWVIQFLQLLIVMT